MGSLNFPTIDAAIANAEGYGISGAIPTTANNPGDLVLGDQGYGTLGNGITVFPTPQAGATALDNQVGLMASGQSANYSPNESISQIGQTYAGTGTQGTNWAQNFAKYLGVSPTSTLGQLLGSTGLPAWASNAQNSFSGTIQGPTGFAGATNTTGTPFNLGRVAAFLIGMVAIAGGIFMLKSSQTIIQTAGRVAKKAVEISG